MPYSEKDLWQEACALIDDAIAHERSPQANWIAAIIVERHPLPEGYQGEDAEFTAICRWEHVRYVVRKAAARFKASPQKERDEQLILPGWDHLQKAYYVTREGVQRLVPIDQMADTEIDQKALEYKRMGEGCNAHAGELRRYLNDRKRAA